jgi:WD40 repeat protein
VTVNETNSGSLIRDWSIPGVSRLALTPNGHSVAVAASLGNAGSLTIYDTPTLDKVGTYSLTYPVNSMGFSPAGSRLFLGSQAGQNVTVLRMWDKTLEPSTQFGAGVNVAAIF